MAPVHVRPLRLPGDIAALEHLDTSSMSDAVLEVIRTADGFTLRERAVNPPRSKRYEFATELDGERAWDTGLVAEVDGWPCGFAATSYQAWNRRLVLWHLYVAPEHRRRGVARALLGAVGDVGRRRGARQLWLETQDVNLPAVRAYQRLGLQLCGFDTTLYDGDAATEVALFMSAPLED